MHDINRNLFKTSQYRFNSGGDPASITELMHEDLQKFHKDYYHPSNAWFLSYGDLDFRSHLEYVGNFVIHGHDLSKESQNSEILLEGKSGPLEVDTHFLPDQMSPADQQARCAIVYLLHECSQDPYESFKLQVLAQLMFEGPNSLMYKSLIETGLAPNYSPGFGFDNTTRQGTFTIGVQGIADKQTSVVLNEIEKVLKKAAKEGFKRSFFETVLHQIEFEAKKTQQHRGLGYLSTMVPHCLHGGDPLAIFRIDEYSQRLREEFDSGVF